MCDTKLLTDISIKVTPQEVMQSISRGKREASWMIEEAEAAVTAAKDLWEPVVIYDWVEITAINNKTLSVSICDSGQKAELQLGPNILLLSKAEMALVAAHSVGSKLDERVTELNRSGEHLAAYLLDSVGVVALGKVGNAAANIAEEEARRRGWGVGARLKPGSLEGWPMAGQRDLCSLLPLHAGGLELTDNDLIFPFKSVSSLIGLGAKYTSSKVGFTCKVCRHKDTCWQSKA